MLYYGEGKKSIFVLLQLEHLIFSTCQPLSKPEAMERILVLGCSAAIPLSSFSGSSCFYYVREKRNGSTGLSEGASGHHLFFYQWYSPAVSG